MKTLIPFLLVIISLTIFNCSEDSTETPPIDKPGKLVIKSNPPGAHIYFMGTNTGKTTPDSIANLEQGTYTGFLYLQYYDTAYFTAKMFNNTTTIIDTILKDGLPFVEFVFDYQTGFGGDSVHFFFTINQDVTMDSIVVRRPIDVSGAYTKDKYSYNAELFEYQDQFGNIKKYYLPPPGSSSQYYPAIQNVNYYISMFGHKAYGAKVEFRFYYQIGL